MARNADYTVGWIAPLPLELTAARAAFDAGPDPIHIGEDVYFGGKVGGHHVVAAVQPEIGRDAASDLAARMRSAFKNIKFFLVVGIGGGVRKYGSPGAVKEMVLGDVVVSCPSGNHGGVVRYDNGAWIDDGRLEPSGHTNGPPAFLLGRVKSLGSTRMDTGPKICDVLQQMRGRIAEAERSGFMDPGPAHDTIFDDDCLHPEGSRDEACDKCLDFGKFQRRNKRGAAAARDIDTPQIHYGNIGSSNQLQISAEKRRQCYEQHGIICFEMEGAGVMHAHPSLVIRGICDYSDSHKNKIWQPYAALAAAAYAKELLLAIPEVKTEEAQIGDRSSAEGMTNHWNGVVNTNGGKFFGGNTFNSGGSMTF